MTNVIEENLLEIETEKLFQLLRQNHVSKAYLFGSVTNSKFSKEKSDIDIIIELVDINIIAKSGS